MKICEHLDQIRCQVVIGWQEAGYLGVTQPKNSLYIVHIRKSPINRSHKLPVQTHMDGLDNGPTAIFNFGNYTEGKLDLPDSQVKLE